MDKHLNIPLKNFTTMRLGGPAKIIAEARTSKEVAEIYKDAKSKSLPVFVLGGGSNVIAKDEGFDGVVIRIRIPGFEVLNDDINSITIKVGAGEIWDETVSKIVEMNLSGVECLSAVPGTTGAAPVQNIGAYGQEIADTLESLTAYDSQLDSFVTLTASECGLSYRNSIFRDSQKGRYVITSVTLKLSKNQPQPPFYENLQKYLDENNIHIYDVKTIRSAIIAIRTNKLPDPKLLPNAGSFFKNAIIEDWQLTDLKKANPDMPIYDMGEGKYKLSTGWLIEQAGLKGQLLHGMRVHDKNALVLINESAQSYHDLALAREEIISAIQTKFNIIIEQEPLEI
jgi:UDP-N-acetylmuramate dehydrogenase